MSDDVENSEEEPKISHEQALESLNQAINDYYKAAGWDHGLLTESVICSAQQIFTEEGNTRTQVYVLPVGSIPPHHIIGLLHYAKMFYDSEIIAAHMPPPMLVQQFIHPEDFGEDDS